jgi:hypothetical protein
MSSRSCFLRIGPIASLGLFFQHDAQLVDISDKTGFGELEGPLNARNLVVHVAAPLAVSSTTLRRKVPCRANRLARTLGGSQRQQFILRCNPRHCSLCFGFSNVIRESAHFLAAFAPMTSVVEDIIWVRRYCDGLAWRPGSKFRDTCFIAMNHRKHMSIRTSHTDASRWACGYVGTNEP